MKLIKTVGLCLTLSALASTSAYSKTISLAQNSKADYTITCSDAASPTVKYASRELEKYLEMMSGADFTVSTKGSAKSIIVCSTAEIDPKIGIPQMTGEDFGIFTRDENIYLTGAAQRSVLYAVYDMLERLGCRWLAPKFVYFEGSHQYIPKSSNIALNIKEEKIEHTNSKYRKFYATGPARSVEELQALIEWMPKLRFNTLAFKMVGPVRWEMWCEDLTPELKKRDIIIEDGGHGYETFISTEMEDGKLFEQKPQWFGVNKRFGEKEQGNRSKVKRVIFCTSNSEAVDYMHSNLIKYLERHPEVDIFDFWPQDSEIWCECDECAKLGSPSDRHALLVNQTRDLLKKHFPKLKMECLAYHHYVAPPTNTMIKDDILVDFADYYQNFEYQFYDKRNEINRQHNESLVKWAEQFGGDISIYSYYRKGFWRSLPCIIPHYMQNDLKYYDKLGVRGVSVYSEPHDWFTYGLNHYTLGKLAWNPHINIDKEIDTYCKTLYLDAAPLARYVYNELENIVRYACVIHQTAFKTDKQYDQYAERVKRCITKIEKEIDLRASDKTLANHLFRLKLMNEYALRSIEMMRKTAKTMQSGVRIDTMVDTTVDKSGKFLTRKPPLDKELSDWLRQYKDYGVFALD